MYIFMKKVQENENKVSYQFEVTEQGESYLNQYGILCYRPKRVYGYCQFNKRTEEFLLDNEKSDSYFTPYKREVIKVQVALIRKKREGGVFPEVIEIATG
jgi:hypothetical protein